MRLEFFEPRRLDDDLERQATTATSQLSTFNGR